MTKDELTIQSPEDVRLQKYKSSLIASGGAMVLFSLWTVLRSIVEINAELSTKAGSEALKPLLAGMVTMGIVDLVLKLYVGLSARQEGIGRGKKRPYRVLGIIIAALSIIWVVYMLISFPAALKLYGLIYPTVTLAVEATVLYAALDLVVSATKVKQLEKEMGRA